MVVVVVVVVVVVAVADRREECACLREKERERKRRRRRKKKECAGVRAREKGEKQDKKQGELRELLTSKDRGFVWVESRLAATGLLLSVADRRGRVSEGEREKGRVRGCKREREKGEKQDKNKRALRELLTSKDRGFSDGSRRVVEL